MQDEQDKLATSEPADDNPLRDENLLTEDQAADLLGISLRTLQNRIYLGGIPKEAYTTAVTGKRFYFRDRLLGATK